MTGERMFLLAGVCAVLCALILFMAPRGAWVGPFQSRRLVPGARVALGACYACCAVLSVAGALRFGGDGVFWLKMALCSLPAYLAAEVCVWLWRDHEDRRPPVAGEKIRGFSWRGPFPSMVGAIAFSHTLVVSLVGLWGA